MPNIGSMNCDTAYEKLFIPQNVINVASNRTETFGIQFMKNNIF